MLAILIVEPQPRASSSAERSVARVCMSPTSSTRFSPVRAYAARNHAKSAGSLNGASPRSARFRKSTNSSPTASSVAFGSKAQNESASGARVNRSPTACHRSRPGSGSRSHGRCTPKPCRNGADTAAPEHCALPGRRPARRP
ncbi:hypothetical protein I552_0634 [Mycobacterium xenopi 3993]|nr:hypothetical protein I552_0634 [Mycobacterium xenopi 3993]